LKKLSQYIPGQFVVHADPDDVIGEVQALIAWKRDARCRVEIRFVLQPDIEILDLCRPVLREFDLDASARCPAPMPLLVGYLADGTEAIVFSTLASAPPPVAYSSHCLERIRPVRGRSKANAP
jgi:hypothetical protein